MNTKEYKMGDDMKEIERETETYIPRHKPYIARLDGRSFSRFTKRHFEKPFDVKFNDIMVDLTKDLVREFNAVTGYTQSDEISLLLVPKVSKDGINLDYDFKGRVQKTMSVMAGFASTRFLVHCIRNGIVSAEDISEWDAHFDSRALPIGETDLILSYFRWRQMDCVRNCTSSFARKYFSTSELHKKHTGNILDMLKDKNIDMGEELDVKTKFGTYIKTVSVDREFTHQGRDIICKRRETELYNITKNDLTTEFLLRIN